MNTEATCYTNLPFISRLFVFLRRQLRSGSVKAMRVWMMALRKTVPTTRFAIRPLVIGAAVITVITIVVTTGFAIRAPVIGAAVLTIFIITGVRARSVFAIRAPFIGAAVIMIFITIGVRARPVFAIRRMTIVVLLWFAIRRFFATGLAFADRVPVFFKTVYLEGPLALPVSCHDEPFSGFNGGESLLFLLILLDYLALDIHCIFERRRALLTPLELTWR